MTAALDRSGNRRCRPFTQSGNDQTAALFSFEANQSEEMSDE
jgi:hypothetical protein